MLEVFFPVAAVLSHCDKFLCCYLGFKPMQSVDEDGSKNEADKEEAPLGKPTASYTIPGTGWHVVWTDTSKFFFFNPTSKTSIWEKPVELASNPVVDEIINAGPSGKKDGKSPSSFKSINPGISILSARGPHHLLNSSRGAENAIEVQIEKNHNSNVVFNKLFSTITSKQLI